ncbi:MAG: hypothetical protein JWL69_4863 [Phycisphaerales bacterium]|nr:hypothetical protein [Phycisphaerales bacterium]MDB5356282.1 hypothetical protein [Phycisphaerales bacterium]
MTAVAPGFRPVFPITARKGGATGLAIHAGFY